MQGYEDIVIKHELKDGESINEDHVIREITKTLEDQRAGRITRETSPIPAVYETYDKFIADMTRYFTANEVDPYDMSDLYRVMEKLFEKGNYKGCYTIGRNTLKTTEGNFPIAKGRNLKGVNDRQVSYSRYYVF